MPEQFRQIKGILLKSGCRCDAAKGIRLPKYGPPHAVKG